jgi:hypothetical protein
VEVAREDNQAVLADFNTGGNVGDLSCEIYVPEDNDYAGAVTMRVRSNNVAGSVYVDACVFQRGPERAETGWAVDASSLGMFGRKERILLEGGLSNAAANDLVASELVKTAWPNPQPPRAWQTHPREQKTGATLSLTCAGYWAWLNWVYNLQSGTRTRSEWVKALVAQQSAIGQGVIQGNAQDFQIEDGDYLRCGDLLKTIAAAGNNAGALWGVGVFEGRRLNYQQIPEELKYVHTNGQLLDMQKAPVEAWRAEPGWCLQLDMPIASSLTSHQSHDPRWVFIEEVTMNADGTIGLGLDESGGLDEGE